MADIPKKTPIAKPDVSIFRNRRPELKNQLLRKGRGRSIFYICFLRSSFKFHSEMQDAGGVRSLLSPYVGFRMRTGAAPPLDVACCPSSGKKGAEDRRGQTSSFRGRRGEVLLSCWSEHVAKKKSWNRDGRREPGLAFFGTAELQERKVFLFKSHLKIDHGVGFTWISVALCALLILLFPFRSPPCLKSMPFAALCSQRGYCYGFPVD